MNLREGMRRVGMVLGLIGFCVGCFGAYDYVNPLLRQTAAAREYQTQHELPPGAKVVRIPETQPKSAEPAEPAEQVPDFDSYVPKKQQPSTLPPDFFDRRKPSVPKTLPPDFFDNAGSGDNPAKRLMDSVDAKKPKTNPWDNDPIVTSNPWDNDPIVTRQWDEQENLITGAPQDTPAAPPPVALWQYLPALAFPLLGFFLPWGAIKALTWIGTGFVTSSAK